MTTPKSDRAANMTMARFEEEIATEVAGWTVIYPATCNGAIRDLGFVYRTNGYRSEFVHFNDGGEPYGPYYMPKKVIARLIAMRNREFAKEER